MSRLLIALILCVGLLGVGFTYVVTSGETGSKDDVIAKAEQGDADAQFALGLKYNKGETVAKDDKQAAGWWQKAAEQGNPSAQFALGMLYATGHGVPQDYVEGYMWIGLAAFVGDKQANKAIDGLRQHLSPAQKQKGDQRIRAWMEHHPKWVQDMTSNQMKATNIDKARNNAIKELGETRKDLR